MPHSVEEIRQLLEMEQIKGIAGYCKKLEPNIKTSSVYRDLLSEAYAALMFARTGFAVTMRESPDLMLDYSGNEIGAEVKRFQRKVQDEIDDLKMHVGDDFVDYGDTVATEGKKAHRQVIDVATKKTSQLVDGIPNIVVIESSSPNCIEDTEVSFAASELSANNSRGFSGDIGRLNGIALMSLEYNLSQKRNVYFSEIRPATAMLTDQLRLSFDAITEWRRS